MTDLTFASPSRPPGSSPAECTARIPGTIGYYAAFVALGLASASLGPTLPGLAEHTQSRLAQTSSLFAARSLGYLIGSVLGGRLYDRVPGHPVMAGGLLLMAGMMALAPLATSLWVLTAAILILGLAEGVLDVGGNTLLVWVHREKVGPFMNGLHFFFGVGAFLSPLIIAYAMLGGGGIFRAYLALAVLLLPGAVWLLRLPSPAASVASPNDPAGRANGRLVALIVTFLFLYAGAEVSFGGWIYSYAVALRLSSDAVAAYLASAFWGALTAGRLLAIPLAVRLPPRYLLLADFLGCLASLGALLLWPHSLVVVWLGTCGLGLSMASIFPTTLSLAQGRMPISGAVTGWFFVGASAGGMTLPWLIGQFFESVGPRVLIAILAVDLTAALGLLAVMAFRFARPVYQRIKGGR